MIAMCWSFSVSTAMAITGATTTVYAARKGQPAAIYLTVGYFTVMEALQAAGYLVVLQLELQLGYTAAQAGAALIPTTAMLLVI